MKFERAQATETERTLTAAFPYEKAHRMLSRRRFLGTCLKGLPALAAASAAVPLAGCSDEAADNQVVIYSCGEGQRNELLIGAMRRDLPHLDVRLHYMSTGNLSARLKVEGAAARFDIALMLEAGYLLKSEESLVDLSGRFDLSVFEDDLRVSDKVMPFTRECGCFAYNTEVLARAGVEPPRSLEDLTSPRFAGMVSMPNPKASSTGYNFYYSMVNILGEQGALDYFDRLEPNVYQFTSSGSAPASALTQGEAGVGLSLVFQLASERNSGAPIEFALFPEGAPWTMNGAAVARGHEGRPAVWEVMGWLYDKGILLDKQEFVPDSVFKGQDTHVAGYPSPIPYADMTGLFELDLKERLLAAWKY